MTRQEMASRATWSSTRVDRWQWSVLLLGALGLCAPCGAQTVLVSDFDRSLGDWQGYGTTRESLDSTSWESGTLRIDGAGTAFVNVWIPQGISGLLRVSGYSRTSGAATAALRGRGRCISDSEKPGVTSVSGWSPFELSSLLGPEVRRVELQAVSEGEGVSWFDDVTVRVIPSDSLPPPSRPASEYLSDAVDSIQAHVLDGDDVDWAKVRRAASRRARGATRACEVWPVIEQVFADIEQPHGWHLSPSEVDWYRTNRGDAEVELGLRLEALSDRTGYIQVPGFPTTDSLAVRRLVSTLHEGVRSLSEAGTCRWIVDLRDNSGGNMWPMLVGLGWILGDGEVGAFKRPGGDERVWSYEDGVAYLAGEPRLGGDLRPADVSAHAPVAVLQGPRTGSSGEAVAVAFRGRTLTRSFGRPTRGLTTSTSSYRLGDGSRLTFATSVFADRTGVAYGGVLRPDVEVSVPREALHSDSTIREALSWVGSLPCPGSR